MATVSFTIRRLRAHAISQTLFSPTTLKSAIGRLGFVQADPIRAPARAQDLILRHRVKHYRAGDLEQKYPTLNLEEDTLYAYGFLTRDVWRLLHPRDASRLTGLQKKILARVREVGQVHPRDLQETFGRERVINAWGGYSQATKRALEALHHRGLLRIARRDKGIRVYEISPPLPKTHSPAERLRKLILVTANLLAPLPQNSLQQAIAHLRRWTTASATTTSLIHDMLRTGELRKESIDGFNYLWPAASKPHEESSPAEPPRRVRFLAPFDPLVWDRRRFEHLWQWPYRFEAYTPLARRVRGYYAMPLLWRDDIVGWANATVNSGRLNLALGFVRQPPREKDFASELEREIISFSSFLNIEAP